MSVEYIKLNRPEMGFGEKNLLESQMDVLNMMRSYRSYQRLRNEEFILKISLKTKMEGIKNKIILLESLLPKVSIQNLKEKQFQDSKTKADLSLEREMELIKEKLAKLR